MILFIIGLSVLIQTATIVLALRLIKITGGRLSWILISASIIGMEARRCITLFQAISGETTSYSLAFELVGLTTSALMLVGIAGISPLVIVVKDAEEKQKNLVARLQDALAKISTLSGILPICASCKKIRDDRGYWNQVEAYIRDHSEAEFSHSICPDCAKKLYPDYFRKDRPSR
ncbi:hypothetical protein NBG4_60011 [Candidatus Sulfobium mesophilum]|uniref:Uncharacterized protein n=1 Tax=Candidatus Sulfobium mesophilum TaxID=2016548 RepID=A0A2U3QJJ4_9BACT|nr:hypothetical protein NBG4_60011 [Candidatus Sulfobium mesophilum]